MKRVLVTGGGGFLGRLLIAGVTDYEMLSFDICDGDVTSFDFTTYSAEHIVHLAARTSVEESWKIPADYYNTNFLGTLNVLEYCRKTGASMTYVSTYIYGTPQYLPIDEKHPVLPHSVYNHSKYLAENLCKFYADNLGVTATILRLFNLYGPGQSENFLIPKIVKQALTSEQIELMDLEPKRDFVYVSDVIEAIRLTFELKKSNVYNVGSGTSNSVGEVCAIIQDIAGTSKPIVSKNITRKNEVMNVIADISNIKTDLHWRPKVDLREGLEQMIEAYRNERG